MAVKSLIEWCDATVNPAYGCFKCSPACANCYAERMAARFSHNPQVAHLFAGTVDASGHWTGKVNLWPERMEQVLHWRKPRRIFVGSMTDLFHQNVPFEFLDRVFAVMALASWHTFCLLTKRPERMREYLEAVYEGERYISREAYIVQNGDSKPAPHIKLIDLGASLPNVWIGTTIWDQASADRNIPELLQCPAVVRYVSCEPMLGPVDLPAIDYIDWVICGAETGRDKRKMENKWARSLRDQCRAAGVPFFFKKDSRGNHFIDGKTHEEFPNA